nr:hypothetical protein [Tanacetum cinerariifolium]
ERAPPISIKHDELPSEKTVYARALIREGPRSNPPPKLDADLNLIWPPIPRSQGRILAQLVLDTTDG